MKNLIFITLLIIAGYSKMYSQNNIVPVDSTVTAKTLAISSFDFTNDGSIPSKYTCDGVNINPSLIIKNIPANAKSLALIVLDPDAPKEPFVHWLMWNIPVNESIEENSAPGTQGKNGKGERKYTGPCPPTGTHHYYFKVYALHIKLDISKDSDMSTLLKAMEGHILAEGELIGLYKKVKLSNN